jgi:PAS domain S-box-containing protein
MSETSMLPDESIRANERFELIAKATHDTIWDWDLKTNLIWWNENFQIMFGYTPDEIEPDISSWYNRVHPEDRDRVIGGIHAIINAGGEYWHDEYRFRRADGSYAHVYDRGYIQHNKLGPSRMVGSMMDISGRKAMEEKLSKNEERLRMAIESTGLGTWDYDLTNDRLNWDVQCKALFGLPPDAHINYSVFLQGLHPDDRDRADKIVKECFDIRSGGNYDIEYRTIGIEDKKLRWVRARGRAFFDDSGKALRFIGTALDITEQKTSSEKLAKSEERLKEALLVAATGTWRIDLKTGTDTRDASLNRMLGLEAVDTESTLSDSYTRMHPEDAPRIREAIGKAVAGADTYDEECRIFRPDGTMRWIRDRGRVIRDASGEPSYMIGAAIDITDQKISQQRIQESEEQFRTIFSNSLLGIAVVGLDFRFIQANPVFCQMLGYTEEELKQKDMPSITSGADAPQNVADSRRMIRGEIEGFTTEKTYIRKNGEPVLAKVWVSLLRDGQGQPKTIVAVATDISQQKKAEEQMMLQARVLDSMDEGVSVSDENGYILYTNPAEDRMFGYDQGEMTGRHVSVQNYYPPEENMKIVSEVIERLKEKGSWSGEWHNKRKDGSGFFTFSNITALDIGTRKLLVCVQRDITEEKQKEEALQKSAEELEKRVEERTCELRDANERLEKSNSDLEQFAYIASHDLQEPLRKIKTFAYRLEEDLKSVGSENMLKYREKVISSSERMTVLIRDLLNYSRLTREETEYERADLNEILREIISDYEVLIMQKQARIEAGTLPVIRGIPLQLRQLFFNLIGNSLKFARPEEPPVLRIGCRKLDDKEKAGLHLPGHSPYYEISFEDNGIGFEPRYREQIFEIFQRLHSRDQYAGTGIGLALSRKVVHNHQGLILAESTPGQGASFKVYLPEEV